MRFRGVFYVTYNEIDLATLTEKQFTNGVTADQDNEVAPCLQDANFTSAICKLSDDTIVKFTFHAYILMKFL